MISYGIYESSKELTPGNFKLYLGGADDEEV